SIVLLPGSARSTKMEAQIIKEYIKQNPEINTLIVVSSPSHTRRAGMIFQKALNSGNRQTYIMTSPSKYSNFTGKGWWKNREDIQIMLSEYTKLLVWLV
ncbi:MAG: ElyC/SanA/YdcF family protein, partial [Bacteroidota bacterium]|nr:ElyC/SanA/YdcF family protein [Bacteroidota bacterium]